MRPRESTIPLFLWIATAILVHLVWGGGAHEISQVIEERLDIRRFAARVEQLVRMKNQTIEVSLLQDEPKRERPDDQREPDSTPKDSNEPPKAEPKPKPEPTPKLQKPADEPKPVAKKPEPEKKSEPAKKAPEDLPKIVAPNRIAVQQHVDKPQEDNPNAEFIANEANKVAEQTQARVTSTDQNDPAPTPAANHSGLEKAPGDSEESKIAQSEDRPGEPDRAPNEGRAPSEKVARLEPRPASSPSQTRSAEAVSANTNAAGRPSAHATAPKSERAAEAENKPETAVSPSDATPETLRSESGNFGVATAQPKLAGRRAQKGRKKHLPPLPNRGPLDMLGLGALGMTASGVNLNLSPAMAFAAVGQDRLNKERVADAERRKSAHRGSWQATGIERWRSAIENYVASVKPGNQTALNTARVPFAAYLNQIHNRLHPIFADTFLASLDHLPSDHPMNRDTNSTNLEIVLSQDEGRIVRMGVTKTSGVTAFDVNALEAVQRAQPFGAPPSEIVSPDGNVYLHWEFYRNPLYACSTYFAHPYMLKVKPKTAPPPAPAPKPRPYDPNESPGADPGQGSLGVVDRLLEKRTALR